ncbi:hypothetical protein AA11826_0640 [Komagataeibacter oboediens DSM 11826]|uniref:GIY-YIG nuclease family protein n=1 Tax=Komagataeibacter oboediens TaxID=65958 RepID=A0A318QGR6_9PROT|nr:GIY-YIG nuclease family protein [Komagataeibacter oboediens]PYD77770.1 hypothetical protein CFR80_17420 [Komagataeibacter oboediens]GBR30399.1 hypothetical protein AA11826_0640 [Komagataeibacter oboediens DSM 11826]
MTAQIIPFKIAPKHDEPEGYRGPHVYIIACEGSENVKIGKAEDVARRVREHQCGSADQLIAIRSLAGNRIVESAFHKRFQSNRKHGEWFRFCPDMMNFFPEGYCATDYALKKPIDHVSASDGLSKWMIERMSALVKEIDPYERAKIDGCASDIPEEEWNHLICSSLDYLINKSIERMLMLNPFGDNAGAAKYLSNIINQIASHRDEVEKNETVSGASCNDRNTNEVHH